MINQDLADLSAILKQVDAEYIISKNLEYIKFTNKNFLTLNIPSIKKYGVEITKNYDESITLNGLCNVDDGIISPIISDAWEETQLPPGSYKFVIKNDFDQFVNPDYLRIELVGLSSTTRPGTKLLDSHSQDNRAFTVDTSYKYNYFRLWIGNQHKFVNETYYLMVVNSDVEDYTYEPSKISLEWAIEQIIENKLAEIDTDLETRMNQINAFLETELAKIDGIPIPDLEAIWNEEMGPDE